MYGVGDTVKVVAKFKGSHRVNITEAMKKHLGKRLVIKAKVRNGYKVYGSSDIWEESMFEKKVKVSKHYKLGNRFKCIENSSYLNIAKDRCFELISFYEDGTYCFKSLSKGIVIRLALHDIHKYFRRYFGDWE